MGALDSWRSLLSSANSTTVAPFEKILYGLTSLVFLGEEFGGFLFVVCVSLGRRGGWGWVGIPGSADPLGHPPPPPRQKVDRKLTFLTWLTWRPLSPEIILIMGIITLLDESNSLNLIGWGGGGGGRL